MAKQKSLFQLDAQTSRLEQALQNARDEGRITPLEYAKRSSRVLLASMEYEARMNKHARKFSKPFQDKYSTRVPRRIYMGLSKG